MREIKREIELYPRIVFDFAGSGKAYFMLRLSDGEKRGRAFKVDSLSNLPRYFDQ